MGKLLDPTRITPATMWTDAKHLRIAAAALVEASEVAANSSDNQTRVIQLLHPTLLLICTSIELGFKAYLNHKGDSLERLKHGFGHDLHALQQEVLRHADGALAQIVNTIGPAIDLLNEPYMGKRFTYRQIGWARYPAKQAVICGWVRAYLDEIKPIMNLPVQGDGLETEEVQPL